MNALDALYRCQRAWEATQPQLFMELWPDDGLDERHVPVGPDGQPGLEAMPLVEPAAAASPEAGGLDCARLTAGASVHSAGRGTGLPMSADASSGGQVPDALTPAVSLALNPGDTEPCRAYVHAELTASSPRVAPPPPPDGGGSVSPLHTTAPGRKTSQSSAAGGRR